MMEIFKNKILALIALVILTGCSDAVCLDADDFGFSHVKVPASYKSSEIRDSGGIQYAPWYDSGLTLDGNTVHAVVKNWEPNNNINSQDELSAWCPWMGASKNPPSLQEVCVVLDTCVFEDNETCSDGVDAKIINSPCILKNGVGLYMLLAPKGFDPNASEESIISPNEVNPKAIVKHLGEKTLDSNGEEVAFYDLQINPRDNTSHYVKTGGALLKLTNQQKIDLVGGKIYFKILDKFYSDNSGQYIVTVKSGVTTVSWDPADELIKSFKEFFFGASSDSTSYLKEQGVIKNIFVTIISNPGYQLAVKAALSLYIIFYALNFLIGNVKVNTFDLLTRVVKILVVSQLLTSATAWDFFNNYIFSFFIEGSQDLMTIIKNTVSGPGSSGIISFMLTPNVLIKLVSLVFVSPETFFYYLVFMVLYIKIIFLIIKAIFVASITYITCVVMMGIIIALAPIFLCFMLFDSTKSLFDNWLRQLASYAIQPLILVTGIAIFSLMVRHQIYQNLGYRVCKKEIDFGFVASAQNAYNTNVSGDDSRAFIPYIWLPQIADVNERDGTGEKLTEILIPEGHYKDSKFGYLNSLSNGGEYCAPYECKGMRYPSLPFLNPENHKDNPDRIFLENFWYGNWGTYQSLLMLIISMYLLSKLNEAAIKIGSFIAGSSVDTTSTVQATASESITMARGAGKVASFAVNQALGRAKKVKNLGDKAWGSAQRAFKNRNSDSGGDSVSR